MAAYAALVSLLNNLDHIHNHPRFSASLDKYQIESLRAHIDFLLDFVENYNIDGDLSKGAEEMKMRIASAAHEAEDIVESHIVNQILPQSAQISDVRLHHRCLFGLQKVIQDMDSIKEKVLRIKEESGFNYQKPPNSRSAASPTPVSTGKSIMVGFDDELRQLMDEVIGQQSSRQIISIVGMGGAGKTTLARNVYEDSLTLHHFDLRAWATISQDYNVKDIFLQLLAFQGKSDESVEKLGERLYKHLFGRRYLIILDDMWSIEVWDKIKFYFPDNGDRSRVVLTTRLSDVAAHLHSFCFRINFLDEHKSWDLFCQIVFGKEDYPSVLVGIGKKISEQCKGLPLTIVVIGGLLRNSPRLEEHWQKVAQDVNSLLSSGENGECLDVLYLSYSQLPAHLKPCFLYMGTFEEDSEIRVSKIIRLWVAEGFLKPIGVQILEEIAEDYLKDLIDRNLILVCSHRSNGKIKSCRIHDLLRELCISVANKEKFFCVVRARSIPRGMDRERRLIFPDQHFSYPARELYEALQSTSLVRSLTVDRVEVPQECKLLRVLCKPRRYNCEETHENVNLRYLDLLHHSSYHYVELLSISLIWNLETLIIEDCNGEFYAPLEIWKMTQLRHLKLAFFFLPDPPPSDKEDNTFVMRNLQTLERVWNFRLSEEACKRIRNIKKLRLMYGDGWVDGLGGYLDRLHDTLQNLGRLHKLAFLELRCYGEVCSTHELKNAFSSSLKKIVLQGDLLDYDDLPIILAALPQLEVLKLVGDYAKTYQWCVKRRFLRLKFLSVKGYNLDFSTLDASCFPVLEKLVLINSRLNEIPSWIGEIPTLQLIRLERCRESLVISAMKIKEEQESFGNYGLLIQARMFAAEATSLRKRVDIEGLSISDILLELPGGLERGQGRGWR